LKNRKRALGEQGIAAAATAAANARDITEERILSPTQAIQMAIDHLDSRQPGRILHRSLTPAPSNLLSGLRWALACLEADPEGWMPIDSEHGPLVGELIELAIPTRGKRGGINRLAGPFFTELASVPEEGIRAFTVDSWAEEPATHWRPRTRGPRDSQ
jgi:hypothetical protein